MPVKYLEYKGMTIKAGAFEFNAEGRYVSILSIARRGAGGEQGSAKLFDPPCPDDLFGDADEALDAAIEHGRAIVGLLLGDFLIREVGLVRVCLE